MRQRYILDKDTLQYVKVERSFNDSLRVAAKYLGAGLIVALIAWCFFVFGTDYSSGKLMLAQENKQIISNISDLNSRFDSIGIKLFNVQNRDDRLYRVVAELHPLSAAERAAGYGGTRSYAELDDFENGELMIESQVMSDQLIKRLEVQVNSYDKVTKKVMSLSDSILSVPGILPVAPINYYLTSPFGNRFHPILRRVEFHDGVDLAGPKGKPVYATGKGVVVRVENRKSGYGKNIMIDHGFGYRTRYAHLNKTLVSIGDTVFRGQEIGTLGNTGRSTGPHLHYEVIYKNKKVDPEEFYASRNDVHIYDQMLQAAQR